MATIYGDPDIPASGPFAERRRREACRRALETCDWERLAPLAQHLAERRLVRARGDAGASLRHLDVDTLREALSRLVCHEWEDGYLIYQLVVEGADPAQVAAERGVSRLMLTEQLRDAIESLAEQYENTAYQGLVERNACPVAQEWPRGAPSRDSGRHARC